MSEPLDDLLAQLCSGDPVAAERVFIAYEPYLRIAVRRRLGHRLRAKVDSMDIVQSVFANVLNGFRAGAWRFAGPPQLRAFLRRIACRRPVVANRCPGLRLQLDRSQLWFSAFGRGDYYC